MTDNPTSFGPREAQPIDSMISQLMSSGWDFFGDKLTGPDVDSSRAWSRQLEADAVQRASDAAAIFGTIEGRRVLEWLCDVTVRRPMWIMNVSDPLLYAAMREGQNAIVYILLRLIAEGRKEQPPERQGSMHVP